MAWSIDGQTPAFLAATRMASLSHETLSRIIDFTGLEDGMEILEVGCGSGEYSIKLGALLDKASFTGIDCDAGFVSFANARAAGEVGFPYELANPANSYAFVSADAGDLPFEAESFDAVISHTFLTAMPDWPSALSEMLRVCRPGATVSSITSMTDNFYGTGALDLFSAGLSEKEAACVRRIRDAVRELAGQVNLVAGIQPRAVPEAFAAFGLEQVRCMPIGQYFCLSDANLKRQDYLRHVELLRAVALEDAARLRASEQACGAADPALVEAYEQLVQRRFDQLVAMQGSNGEWSWYGNSALLVCGTKPRA